MKYYEELLRLRCFRLKEAAELTGSENAAMQVLRQYIEKGYVRKVRRGLYTAVNLLDHESAASPYLIASRITDTAVVSHHSAFRYHGVANQVSYEMSVSSDTKFNAFDFEGYHYRRLTPGIHSGIMTTMDGARITDIERTILDSIKDFEKDLGFEELIQCISAVPVVDERKLSEYLAEFSNCFLYQKTGLIFEQFRESFGISDSFLSECRERAGKSSRYLFGGIPKDRMEYSSKWRLMIPKDLWRNNLNGDEENAEI